MITHDQIPLVRLSAKRSLEHGRIDQKEYNEILRSLDKMEQNYRAKEKIRQERMIHSLNKAFFYA